MRLILPSVKVVSTTVAPLLLLLGSVTVAKSSLSPSSLSSAPSSSLSSDVLDLDPSKFDEVVIDSGIPSLVEFFAPWCGHCKNLAPIYEDVGRTFAHAKEKINIAKVNVDQHKSLGKRFDIKGFPTIKYFDGKSKSAVDYEQDRDLDSFIEFITTQTGIRAKPQKKPRKQPSEVVILNDETFSNKIGGDHNVLVAFTAPWCGHCKSLAPTWESVAHTFSRDPNVIIAKVDAESPDSKSIAQEHNIKSYPTIKFFAAGETEPVDFDVSRTASSIVDYVNEHAGTYRLVDGKLNDQAGVITGLADYVKGIVRTGEAHDNESDSTSDTITDSDCDGESDCDDSASDDNTNNAIMITDSKSNLSKPNLSKLQLLKLAVQKGIESNQIRDQSAAKYYVRVAEKFQLDREFPTKERARLSRILDQSPTTITPDKTDDLIRRMNILQQFITFTSPVRDEL